MIQPSISNPNTFRRTWSPRSRRRLDALAPDERLDRIVADLAQYAPLYNWPKTRLVAETFVKLAKDTSSEGYLFRLRAERMTIDTTIRMLEYVTKVAQQTGAGEADVNEALRRYAAEEFESEGY